MWDFWKQAGANAMGALLGVFLALYADRVLAKRRRMEEKRDLIVGLNAALERNLWVLKVLEDGWNDAQEKRVNWVPTFSTDLVLLQTSAMRKYDLGIATTACKAIDQALFELSHLNLKLDMLRSNFISRDTAMRNYSAIARTCVEHIKGKEGDGGIRGHVNTALELLAKENMKLPTIFDHDPMGELVGRS
jgi:hypothetical protein